MYRLFFFVLLFAILIPIVWRIVNKVFSKVSNELSEDKESADDVIDSFLHQKSQMEKRQRQLESESRRAMEEAEKLERFSGNSSEKETKE